MKLSAIDRNHPEGLADKLLANLNKTLFRIALSSEVQKSLKE